MTLYVMAVKTISLVVVCVLIQHKVAVGYLTHFNYNGHMYSISSSPKKWQEADEYCQSHDLGRLVVFQDKEEAYHVHDLIYSVIITRCWVGLTDAESEGDFRTIDNGPAPYLAWASSTQPNGGELENCLSMASYRPKFHDDNCDSKKRFVCKTVSAPESTAMSMTSSVATTQQTTTEMTSEGRTTLTTEEHFETVSSSSPTTSMATTRSMTTVTSSNPMEEYFEEYVEEYSEQEISRGPFYRSAHFLMEADDKAAIGRALHVTAVPSFIACAHACLSRSMCASFNMESGVQTEDKNCELFEEVFILPELFNRPGYSYFRKQLTNYQK
ncbi:uncharacterized protein [Ptychodera flava]|uniref:uncharacterized protein n=1 Tax=Ptychodera flava TaxID=63121 RepID=UPI00396AA93F